MKHAASAVVWPVSVAAALIAMKTIAQPFSYPETRTVDQVDDYHGTTVADPYRWLEDDMSDETAAWVEAQNAVTFPYLEGIPFRADLLQRVTALNDYERYSAPMQRGPYLFFRLNSGLQNQSVLYVQQGLDGTPEVLLDPNSWSDDGTVQLAAFSVSRDARYAVYGISESGSDWQEYRVLDLETREELDDRIEWVKVSNIGWHGDGFYYSRYPEPEGTSELASINENHQVFFHRIGTSQAEDQLVYEDPEDPQRFHIVETTEDERFAVLSISDRGSGHDGNALYVRDLAASSSEFAPLIAEIDDDAYSVVGSDGDGLLIATNDDAPNWRVLRIEPGKPDREHWVTVLAEQDEPLDSVRTAGGRLFASYLQNVTTRTDVHNLLGILQGAVDLPGPGTATGFGAPRDASFVFYTFQSMNEPPTIYRYEIETGESTVFRQPQVPGYDPAEYETQQVFYPSKDGTQIPMFLVHRRGIELDGNNPTLLYGYGGFNITLQPAFSAARVALLEQGFVYAIANLRGGGEYGEEWHRQGMKLEKQNVFDDFIAAAEWLIENDYTSSARLAINGGSNGGLLVGAVINQRPELFGAAVPQVGVMDMLRFQEFTIGWNWIADYGSSENPEEFEALYAYSPLHNIQEGVTYPPTLITTADHDDRVVPAHSFKYAAMLQALASPDNPALIRIDTKSGHGASSLTKALEATADVYAFVMQNLDVEPVFEAVPEPD